MSQLQQYVNDAETIVAESCLVALDVADYLTIQKFQYADRLKILTEKNMDASKETHINLVVRVEHHIFSVFFSVLLFFLF
jgi:hypothetical protein